MRSLILNSKVLIGHNIVMFDVPVLEKILGIKVKARLIDTLPLSWYLNHKRHLHGLNSYGEDFGIPKPKVEDWVNLTPEEYAYRCDEDVKINSKLWSHLKSKLLLLYGDKSKADKLITYLTFKMYCLRLQSESKWKMDKQLVEDSFLNMSSRVEGKKEQLRLVMPKVKDYSIRTRPKKPFKKDGTYSAIGEKWFALLKSKGLHKEYVGEIEILVGEHEPNPGSHAQVKDWLYSLGWIPTSFKYVRDNNGNERKIPQVRIDGGGGKILCPSVIKLKKIEPALEILEGLTILEHRVSILKGFLRDNIDGYLTARAIGLTNTLRLKHTELVNLPGIDKPYGDIIRGSLIAREGKVLCGADMVSLEDTTKRHYMWDYDPNYVKEMSIKGFDPHLDLAKFTGAVTEEEIHQYVNNIPTERDIKGIRKGYKIVNYSATYGVKEKTLSRQSGLSLKESKKLLEAYWERNWSLKEIANNVKIKKVNGDMWLLNPVSNFWYSLRSDKDRFSTLNQGTGVYCFDTWLGEALKIREQLTAQFHDEIVLEIKKGADSKCTALLKEAIKRTNEKLNLNIELDVDVQFGYRYSDIH